MKLMATALAVSALTVGFATPAEAAYTPSKTRFQDGAVNYTVDASCKGTVRENIYQAVNLALEFGSATRSYKARFVCYKDAASSTAASYSPVWNGVDTIRVNTASAARQQAIIHELGHMLDYERFGAWEEADHSFSAEKYRKYDAKRQAVREAVAATPEYSRWAQEQAAAPRREDRGYARYLTDQSEMFARAYTQYVGQAYGKSWLVKQYSEGGFGPGHWAPENFEKVSAAMGNLL